MLKERKFSSFIKLNPTNIALLLQEATQKYGKLIIEQNTAIFLLFSLSTATCASFAFLNSSFFSVLGQMSSPWNYVEFET